MLLARGLWRDVPVNPRGRAGQAQILAASVLGVVMITGGLFSLQHAAQSTKSQLITNRRSEMRSALEAAIKHASYIYHSESGCDPVAFDKKLNRLQLDGTLLGSDQALPAAGARQMNVTVGNQVYRVALGPVTRLAWRGNGSPAGDPSLINLGGTVYYKEGFSQDAMIEVWTNYLNPTSTVRGGIRVLQRAVLINNCTYPCAGVAAPPLDPCLVRRDQAIGYHSIVSPSLFPLGSSTVINPDTNIFCGGYSCSALGPQRPGDINFDSIINVTDLLILKNYLRSGDMSGAGAGAGSISRCVADLNRDALVNETDLGILEKALRGYLYWLPAHY